LGRPPTRSLRSRSSTRRTRRTRRRSPTRIADIVITLSYASACGRRRSGFRTVTACTIRGRVPLALRVLEVPRIAAVGSCSKQEVHQQLPVLEHATFCVHRPPSYA
jgi:hypothetical protein